MTEQLHYCYILYNNSNMKTYVGYTVDPVRRLRQHNGHLVGGARYTSKCKGGWSFLAVITSPFLTSNLALSLEWHVKHGRFDKQKGSLCRILSLVNALKTKTKFKHKEYHLFVSEYGQRILPNHVFNEMIQLQDIILYDDLSDIL